MNCPVCGKGDNSQKVDVVYNQGIEHGHVDYQGNMHSTKTNLSIMLSPPVEPTRKMGCLYGFLLFIALYFLLVGLVTLVAALLAPVVLGKPEQTLSYGGISIVSFSLVWLFGVRPVLKKKSTFKKNYPKWQRNVHIWNNAYFCSRDGIVFVPGRPDVWGLESFQDWMSYKV